jgi:predicted GNAT family acetyltransferase
MALTVLLEEAEARLPEALATSAQPCTAFELAGSDEAEVLSFLAERPIHTVFMASVIRDNGLVSPLTRGTFYGLRDHDGRLQGVALIGHATLIEARTETSLAAFAQVAQQCTSARLIRGERDMVHRFWSHYASVHLQPRVVCRELMLEQRTPYLLRESVTSLRQACPEDLPQVVAVNSEMASKEDGTDPLKRDPQGFIERTARRIEQGRVWLWVKDGKLIFKADIVADTPQAVYLEGVYVNPDERGKGYGLRCLTQLGWALLARTESICLTVSDREDSASNFYYKAGYRLSSYYETIYL